MTCMSSCVNRTSLFRPENMLGNRNVNRNRNENLKKVIRIDDMMKDVKKSNFGKYFNDKR